MADLVDEHTCRAVGLGVDEQVSGFKPQVVRPAARMRPIFVIALVATSAFALGVIAWDTWIRPRSPMRLVEPASVVLRGCTPLEVEQAIRDAAMTDIERGRI